MTVGLPWWAAAAANAAWTLAGSCPPSRSFFSSPSVRWLTRGCIPAQKWSRMYAPGSTAYFWYCPSTVSLMRRTSCPSRSSASSGSQSRPQMTLMAFHPAPRKAASSSWMICPFPRTGPSSRCRLQLTTKIRLSSCSRAASVIAPSDSGSSVSPSPTNTHTLASDGGSRPRSSR